MRSRAALRPTRDTCCRCTHPANARRENGR
jgi:hypothetical protein